MDIATPEIIPSPAWGDLARLNKERDLVGIYLSAHPLDEYAVCLLYTSNGGGYENSANMLAGLLIPEASRKKVFAVFSDNKGQSYSNDRCV